MLSFFPILLICCFSDDLGLLKELSKVGIAALFNKLSKDSNVRALLANARFRKLGVIIDIQCYKEEIIMSTFLKVSYRK